jgi:hypothetical protein
MAMLARAQIAGRGEIAQAFGVHRNTVGRLTGLLEAQGMPAVVPAKRGPKGPHTVTSEVREVVVANSGLPLDGLRELVAERTGIRLSRSHLHRLRQELRSEQLAMAEVSPELREPVPGPAEGPPPAQSPVGPAELEPAVMVPEQARGRYMGAALYYPALRALGLVEAARHCFRLPNSDQFGVRAVTLTLFFLALFSKTTVEAAKYLRRWEFGALIGAERAPVVKTLRRKLAELVSQAQATEFGWLLARRWVEQALIATAYLYVDGHMKLYGGKRKLRELWNSQRRMPLPGFSTYFVGDRQGRPLLFLTEEAGSSLVRAMPEIVREVRLVVGGRRFTMIFDRGGYDSQLFHWLRGEGIDFITYQQGNPDLPGERFCRRRLRLEGRRVHLSVAEDQVMVKDSGPWRRIVVRTASGHQTPILTSLPAAVPAVKVACLIIARWGQENFFRYMRQHMGLDELTSYAWQAAPGERPTANPQRKQLDLQIKELRRHLAETQAELGQTLLEEPSTRADRHALGDEQRQLMALTEEFEQEIAKLVAYRKTVPRQVPAASLGRREELRLEQKSLIDRVKIAAYNAEEWMLERLLIHYPNPHNARALLRSFAQLSGELRTGLNGLQITLDPPDDPSHRRALRGLCADLNRLDVTLPDTDRPVTYHVGVHHSEDLA